MATEVVLGLVVVAGAVARIAQSAQRRSLFIDDVQLVLNVAMRDYGELVRPLLLEQSAPLLFLWIQRFMVGAFGTSDTTVTLIPLLAGLAALPVAWLAARRILDRETSMLAVAMLAVSPPLIYYCTSAKQYESDVFVAVVLAWLGLRVLDAPERSSRWAAAIGGGVIALTASMPALFVLGGVWCAWALDRSIRATRRGKALLLVSGALWGATFMALYIAMYAAVADSEYMRRFWDGFYLSSQTTAWSAIRYLSYGLQATLFDIESGTPWALVAALMVLMLMGAAVLVHERRYGVAALLTVPVLLAIAASALEHWILGPRFMLYSAPFVCILVAHGTVASLRRITARPRYREALVLAGGLAVLALPARYSFWVLRHPDNAEASRELVRRLLAHARHEEPVYVYARALPLWTYYSTDWKRPDTARVRRLLREMREIGPGSGNIPSRGHAVRREGFERRHAFRRSVELIGIATGMESTADGGGASMPDSGWAENEAERIREVASPTVWIAFAHYGDVPLAELRAALARQGGHVTYSEGFAAASLHRYRFTSR